MATSDANELNTWHLRTLPRATLKALTFLSKQAWLKQSTWYLAGGTALALQAGHRRSVDLDFFSSEKSFSSLELISNFPLELWESNIVKDKTVYGKLCGAKISFIAYPFFLHRQPYHEYGACPILDIQDIAVMKILAVSQRGRKRDFVDLYWYTHHRASLTDIMRRLPEQYPGVVHDYHHLLKSFTYFDDAENDPMPTLYFKATWNEIKAYFRKEVPLAAKELLGI